MKMQTVYSKIRLKGIRDLIENFDFEKLDKLDDIYLDLFNKFTQDMLNDLQDFDVFMKTKSR